MNEDAQRDQSTVAELKAAMRRMEDKLDKVIMQGAPR